MGVEKENKLRNKAFDEAGVRVEEYEGQIYVYLDTPEAVNVAKRFLPETLRGVADDGSECWVYNVPDIHGS